MTEDMVVPSFEELFPLAEQLRKIGDNEGAIEFYRQIEEQCYPFYSGHRLALHHMWGVALLGLGQIPGGIAELASALSFCSTNRELAAVQRDLSRGYLHNGQLGTAEKVINESIRAIPLDDLAERGISLGFKARVLLKQGETLEALELFGTADALLQRGDNCHYELYNLLHYLDALMDTMEIIYCSDIYLEALIKRAEKLAAAFGGKSHQDRVRQLNERFMRPPRRRVI